MYKPEQKNARLLNLVIAGCAMLAVAAYFGALAVQSYRWIFQIAIILSATAALFLWSRYTLTWFAYQLRQRENGDGGEELVVFKGQGRKEGVMEALLPLDALIEVIPVHRGTPVDVKKTQRTGNPTHGRGISTAPATITQKHSCGRTPHYTFSTTAARILPCSWRRRRICGRIHMKTKTRMKGRKRKNEGSHFIGNGGRGTQLHSARDEGGV